MWSLLLKDFRQERTPSDFICKVSQKSKTVKLLEQSIRAEACRDLSNLECITHKYPQIQALYCRQQLQSQGIEWDQAKRQELIWNAACQEAQAVGGSIPEAAKLDLLLEVADLVEMPSVLRGNFEPSFLSLPE